MSDRRRFADRPMRPRATPPCRRTSQSRVQICGARDEATPSNRTNDVSYKAQSMSGFKEPGFADRQKAAQQAKKNLLNKFRAQPGPDDPTVAQRRAEREAIAARREKTR